MMQINILKEQVIGWAPLAKSLVELSLDKRLNEIKKLYLIYCEDLVAIASWFFFSFSCFLPNKLEFWRLHREKTGVL